MNEQEEIPGLPRHGLGPKQIPDLPQEYCPGWGDLVARAHAELLTVCPTYEARQVKTKFGGLRLYIAGNQAAHEVVRRYEQESYTICEFCGRPGTLVQVGYWVATLCIDDEAAQRAQRRTEGLDED